jgi:diketogulonate reductase-like aldo/keto reductase
MNITDIKGKVKLANGIEMPYFGLGVFLTKEGPEVENSVKWALESGYIHIDTAAAYGNERGVSKAVKASGIPREEIFITTKVWNDNQRQNTVMQGFEQSLENLQTDYVDLLLIHWPVKGKFIQTWKTFEEIYRSGRARAIGVSNFLKHHLEELLPAAEITPMVNQVESHPYLVQQDLQDFCRSNQIQYEAWSPLIRGEITNVPLMKELTKKYGKTEAQIVLRWDLQKDIITIPKSIHKERIEENANIFDFELEAEDIKKIDSLDQEKHFGAHPDTFTF